MAFDRVEKFFASLGDGDRGDVEFADELNALEKDRAARGRYLAIVRATEDPAMRVRMIALARNMGWLDAGEQRAELVHVIVDVLAARDLGFGEVDLSPARSTRIASSIPSCTAWAARPHSRTARRGKRRGRASAASRAARAC